MKPLELQRTLLLIDDDRIFCQSLHDHFHSQSHRFLFTHTAKEALRICSTHRVDVVLLDEHLPDAEGHTLCPAILESNEQVKIIFITAFPSFEHAVKAIKAGAYDYLSKPFDLEELELAIHQSFKALELEKLRLLQTYQTRKEKESNAIIGELREANSVQRLIGVAATTESPVLITGETGTGKNMVARTIHYSSAAHDAPFIAINCAALPESLIEAELFGHEKGAFTGASSMRKGIFEIAEGGTLFLDEIGAMPLHLQSKLLGVLDDGKIRRLGGQSVIPVHVRIIAATNANPETMMRNKTFREDLYYRISVLRLHMPPLRERLWDIPALCQFFMSQIGGKKNFELRSGEIDRLQKYAWPGNIRELRNIIERSILLHGDMLRPSELLVASPEPAGDEAVHPPSESQRLVDIETEHIKRIMEQNDGNLTRSARVLGISLSTLKRKIRQIPSR